MVKIRLKRCGRNKKPVYRIVAADTRTKRNGKPIEELGFYDPINNKVHLKTERIKKRIEQGAQLTRVINDILIRGNII